MSEKKLLLREVFDKGYNGELAGFFLTYKEFIFFPPDKRKIGLYSILEDDKTVLYWNDGKEYVEVDLNYEK